MINLNEYNELWIDIYNSINDFEHASASELQYNILWTDIK